MIGGFVFMLVLMLVIEVGALRVNDNLVDLSNDIYLHPLTVSNAVRDANTNIVRMHRDMKDVALARNAGELEAAITRVALHETAVNKYFKIIEERFLGDKSMIVAARRSFAQWRPIRAEVIELIRAGKYEQAATITKGKGARHVIRLHTLMNNLIDVASSKASQFLSASKREQERSRVFFDSMLFVVALVGSAIAIFVVVRVHSAENRIMKAKSEAERANKAKTEFLSAMSHDLRTPLNAIIGFSNMMTNETYGPLGHEKYQEYSKDIGNSGLFLLNMINDILDLSKIEADRYQLENSRLKVPEIVSTALRMLGPQIKEKGLKVTTDMPDDLPNLWCDQRVVLQILVNLIANAVKFTENNGSIKAHACRNVDTSVSVSISDTGIGMSADEIVNVMEPFYRADSHHAQQQEGTGLGLHLCKKMAGLIDATLSIKSGPGGTTVTLAFPKERSVEQYADLRLVK